MKAKEPIILPEKYYLDYFKYLLAFVERHYGHVLAAPEYLFLQEFDSLTEDAQCLYLRCSNRKGDFFRISKMNYHEIVDITAAKEELLHTGFFAKNETLDTIQFKLFTKNELIHIFDFLDKKARKSTLLQELTESDMEILQAQEEIIQTQKNQEVEFIKLLFFGNRYSQMTEFVIRDIGNVQIKSLDEAKFQPWFSTREEALAVMHLSQLKPMVREVIANQLPLEEFLSEMPWTHWLQFPRAQEAADKLLLEIGAYFEKRAHYKNAVRYFSFAKLPPARERTVRILDKLDNKEAAVDLARDILEDPKNASELTFATDYLNKSGMRIDRSMTRRLQKALIIDLARSNDRVERQVLSHFGNEGWEGIHAENFIWKNLFGLVFWEELFREDYGDFHHPLQRQPSDLNHPAFYLKRKMDLETRLKALRSKKALFKHVMEVFEENKGLANRFVYWTDQYLPIAEMMINKLPLKGLKKVLLEIARQTKDNSTGFPDLFIWNETDYRFYEVKSPNDHLSAQQLFWLNFLTAAGIKADIIRVKYTTK
ncbi:MAG: VRR-NUC domain-containing protein [Bacteroidota bacterium]